MAGTPDGVPATGTSGLVQTGAVTHERIPVDLTGVPETLLWTLSFRAQEAARPDALLADPLAVDLVRRIDYPFAERLGSGANRAQWQALRSATFDRVVRAFLGSAAARGRAPVVVSLGEGLETAFWRCDDGRVEWVGVDLPETAALRRAVLPPHERRVHVDGSVLDDEWLDAVRDVLARTGSAPSDVLVHAQGLLMYLRPAQVHGLVARCAAAFPSGGLVFDGVPAWTSRATTAAMRRASRDAGPGDGGPRDGVLVPPPMPWPVSRAEVRALRALPGVRSLSRVHPPAGRGAVFGALLPAVERLPFLRDAVLSVWLARFEDA